MLWLQKGARDIWNKLLFFFTNIVSFICNYYVVNILMIYVLVFYYLETYKLLF